MPRITKAKKVCLDNEKIEKINEEKIQEESVETENEQSKVLAETVDTKTVKPKTRKKNNEVQIKINAKTCVYEIILKTNKFKITFEKHGGYQVYIDKNNSYVVSNKMSLKITCKKNYILLSKENDLHKIETNNAMNIDKILHINNLCKEKDIISFNCYNIKEVNLEDKFIVFDIIDDIFDKRIEPNDTLLISEEEGKVYLPYTENQIRDELKRNPKYNVDDVINNIFTRKLTEYKNSVRARYIEGYKLLRYVERKSIIEAMMLGIELMFEFNLNPAIISACKSLEELDIYLDCLEDNELEKFSCFKIKYICAPTVTNQKDIIAQKI